MVTIISIQHAIVSFQFRPKMVTLSTISLYIFQLANNINTAVACTPPPPLFLQNRGPPFLFLQRQETGHLTVCEHPGTAPFLFKKCSPLENSWLIKHSCLVLGSDSKCIETYTAIKALARTRHARHFYR